jgi:glycerophosphoryl diester phosphodiesterase
VKRKTERCTVARTSDSAATLHRLVLEIIAHRGASSEAPENTLAAVELAWVQGADAVEVDVQLSKDGQLVVFHDADTRRTAGSARKVCEQTLSELRLLDSGGWKATRWASEKIPTLEEVLGTIPTGKRLFVEIKCGPSGLANLAKSLRRRASPPNQVVLIGFCLETMKLAKKLFPQLEVGWVAEFKRDWRGAWTPKAQQLVVQAKAADLDALDLSARGPWTPRLGKQVHEAGLKLYVWTVDSVAKARQVIDGGVDGITTNRPGWLRERLMVL